MAYDAIEPIGDERADVRAAMLAWVTTEMQRSSETRKDHPLSIDDFMVVGGKKRKPEEAEVDAGLARYEAMKASAMALAQSMGGIIVEGE